MNLMMIQWFITHRSTWESRVSLNIFYIFDKIKVWKIDHIFKSICRLRFGPGPGRDIRVGFGCKNLYPCRTLLYPKVDAYFKRSVQRSSQSVMISGLIKIVKHVYFEHFKTINKMITSFKDFRFWYFPIPYLWNYLLIKKNLWNNQGISPDDR
jgi:hypothetical protein